MIRPRKDLLYLSYVKYKRREKKGRVNNVPTASPKLQKGIGLDNAPVEKDERSRTIPLRFSRTDISLSRESIIRIRLLIFCLFRTR